MRTFAVFAVAAGLVAAQSSSSTTSVPVSGCGTSIDAIIASCLTTETTTLQACAANDWDCMCSAQQSVVTCYNNCPSDPSAFGAKQQEISWCNAAKQYAPASTTAASSAAVTAASSSVSSALASASSAASSASSSASSSATSSASSSTSSGSAAGPALAPAGGLLALLFGVAALL